jgi:hypothetical protein
MKSVPRFYLFSRYSHILECECDLPELVSFSWCGVFIIFVFRTLVNILQRTGAYGLLSGGAVEPSDAHTASGQVRFL